MPTRKITIAPREYYHILARGVNKQQIFFDSRDYTRFLFYVLLYQSPKRIYNTSYYVTKFIKEGDFGIGPRIITEIVKNRYAGLVNFSFMPNHIHLIASEVEEGGISKMMQRILDGYTRYTHIKYKKSGHVFEGPFKAVHIKDNRQLLYLSTYIHKNPKELKEWNLRWENYPWSSYRDLVTNNRWEDLLAREIILEQFKNPKEYARFTRESIAKEKLDSDLLIDSS